MRPGIITHYGNHGRYRQGDVIFAEPTNRAMRRLTAKQAGNEKGRPAAPNSKQHCKSIQQKDSTS